MPAPGHAQEEEDISIELDDVDFPSRPSPNENQAANAGMLMLIRTELVQ